MNHVALFSSYIPEKSLALGSMWLGILRKHFSNDQVYIGDNFQSCDAWKSTLDFAKFPYRKVPEKFHIDSDVSGFMEALKQLKESKDKFDLVWFLHTKGSSRDANYALPFFNHFSTNLFDKKKDIERAFKNNPTVGLIGNNLVINRYQVHNDNSMRMEEFYPFKCKPIGYFVMHTFYVMRGDVVHEFIHNCDPRFFEKNLVIELGYDRWFFEANFCAISDRMGKDCLAMNCQASPQHDFMMTKMQEWKKDSVNYTPEIFDWK